MKRTPIRRWVALAALTVVIIGAIVVAALPWWMGGRIEAEFTHDAAAVEASAGLGPGNVRYNRGWLSSTAHESLTLAPLPITVEASYHIRHGPFLPGAKGRGIAPATAIISAAYSLRPTVDASPELAMNLTALTPMRMRVRVGLDGAAVGHLTVPAGSLQLATKRFSWASLRAQAHFMRDGSRLSFIVHLPSVRFVHDQMALQVQDVSLNSDLHRGAAGVLLGYSAASARSISIPGALSVLDAHAETRSQLRRGLMAIDLETGLSEVELSGQNIGPASLSLKLRRLDPLALRQFLLQVASVARRDLPPEQAQMLLFGRVLQLAGALSRRNPAIEIHQLTVGTQYGDMSGKANLTVLGAKQDISANPMLLLTATTGDAQLSVPKGAFQALIKSRIRRDMNFLLHSGRLSEKEAARLTPETVESITEAAYPAYLRSSGLLRYFHANGDQYLFRLALQRGVVRVNGKAVNLFAARR